MEPLLDNLTLAPAAQLFQLEPPHYTSSYGRRTEAIFKHNVPPAPMLVSPDNGLILYERVISTKAEHQLLDKLTKPKYYHPTPTIRKSTKGAGSHGATLAPTTGTSTTSSHGPHPPKSAAQRRPSSGRSSPHPPSGGPSSSGAADSDSRSAAGASTAATATSSGLDPGGHPGQPHHRTRSFSAGRAGPAGPAAGTHLRRKPLYPEDGPLKDYFSKERASVTATTMFTWGNRYKIGDYGRGGAGGGGLTLAGGGGGGGARGGDSESGRVSFSAYVPLQQKPPLRL